MRTLLLLVCASCVCAGFQDTPEWEQLMDTGRTNLMRLDFAGAAVSFDRAARLAEKLPPEGGELVRAINGLATAHKNMGRLAESAREYRRAIDLSAGTRLRGSVTYAYLLANLAAVEIERRSFGEARQMLAEAIEIDERIGPDSVQLAIARQLMGSVMMHEGEYESAEKLVNQAISVMRNNPEAPPDLEPFALEHLGHLRRLQRRSEEALAAFRQALEKFERILGPDHPVLVLELNNIAVQLTVLGRKAEARSNFERAVTLLDRYEKANPATKGQILSNYAAFLRKAGDSRQANLVARRASAIQDSLPVDVSALGTRTFRKE
ncbi:MAG: tetratricopeptide repeat protein [Candidatus Solibacter sp.]